MFWPLKMYFVTHISLLFLLHFIHNKIFLKEKLYILPLTVLSFLFFEQGDCIFILHWASQMTWSALSRHPGTLSWGSGKAQKREGACCTRPESGPCTSSITVTWDPVRLAGSQALAQTLRADHSDLILTPQGILMPPKFENHCYKGLRGEGVCAGNVGGGRIESWRP